MCYCKQWRYPRTKVRHLVQLDVDLEMAIKHEISRKRYWRMDNRRGIILHVFSPITSHVNLGRCRRRIRPVSFSPPRTHSVPIRVEMNTTATTHT